VKLVRRNAVTHTIGHTKSSTRGVYLFYEKTSGTAHFHIEAGPDGELPVDHAAGLLAMHCMVRGQSPSDYMIMVPATPESVNGLEEKTRRLLEAGQSAKTALRLTRREEEVLDGIQHSKANKEIANDLNLSERTVKFHVSSLLAKFKVRSRMELVREAARHSVKAFAPAAGPLEAEFRELEESTPMFQKHGTVSKVLPLSRHRLMA
jgi:DNA-binding NarL/FixJ family response regulator